MSYINKDEQLLLKIKKYKNKLVKVYDIIEMQSDEEIDDGLDGLALAQCLTNLYELALRLESEDISNCLSILTSKKIQKTRNIASHDYDAINWAFVKLNCKSILESLTDDIIEKCFKIAEEEKNKVKDYTLSESELFKKKQ